MIKVDKLTKTYTTYERGGTFREALKSLIIRKKKMVEALKAVSFEVGEGELIGFLGPNGAGKSTTLKILTGILFPTSGSVEIMGYVPWKDRRKYVANIGAVFGQKSQLLFDIPPMDSFLLNQSIYNIPEQTFRKTMNEMVEMLDLEKIVRKPTRQLSLGERMKCEFIMAMLHKPKIVFLDEPTIGLDVIAKGKIREFILDQNKKGTTFILTTHDLEDVEHLAKRVIVVNHGEIVFDNTMDKLRTHLGNKKAVHVTTHNPLPSLNHPGIIIRNQHSDRDAEFELDLSRLKLNEFIKKLNEESVISDMSIENLEIENIIKDLYGREI
ncbi:MAG: ATP-binding cassette domain-containing protein [Clostridiaceae bacterium]|jgi:ABC-2 type transport system ATP-binding protein|nr:ATP-binding cassette domain-containing protein [Clostridiaceae bacterium]